MTRKQVLEDVEKQNASIEDIRAMRDVFLA